jgi:quercetin dioxygenase-like cupin family protein
MKIKSYLDVKMSKLRVKGAKGVAIRWLISQLDGASNFVMRLFEFEEGGNTPLHTHPYEHEVYILEGKGVLVYEKKEYNFEKGYCLFVPPNKLHQFKNTGKAPLKMLCLIPTPKWRQH